jgi:hypothetical protein
MKIQRVWPWVMVMGAALCCGAQQSAVPIRDGGALALLTHTVAVLGRVPSDVTLQGTVDMVLGSQRESGTFRILSRGSNEALTELKTNHRDSVSSFAPGSPRRKKGQKIEQVSAEQAMSSEAPTLPLAELEAALGNPNISILNLGSDTVNGIPAYHLRLQNTFATNARMQRMSEYTERDLWIDSSSGLPLKVSCYEREAGGSAPRLLVELFYADYRSVSGVTFPFYVMKAVNEVPQATFKVTSVTFDKGLSDNDFSIAGCSVSGNGDRQRQYY